MTTIEIAEFYIDWAAEHVCQVNAIIQEGFKAPSIDEKKCINCGRCLRACPYSVFQSS